MKKKLAALLAGIIAITGLTGCNDANNSSNADNTTSQIWNVASDAIVAKMTSEVSDKSFFDITFDDFYNEYKFTIENKGLDESDTASATYVNYYRNNIISMLTNERIILWIAKEEGLDKLTDAEQKEIDDALTTVYENWYSSFETEAKAADSTLTGDALTAKEKELFEAYLAGFNLSTDNFVTWQTNSFIENKVLDKYSEGIEVSDKEAEDYFTKQVAAAKAAYEKKDGSYESDTTNQTFYIPEKSRKIKYVYIGLETADATELYSARNESGADDAAVDKKRDELLAGIKDKADKALAAVKADGAKFDDVVKEYSEDYKEDSGVNEILIVPNTTSIPENLYNAIFAVEKEGECTDLVATDGGYYIVQYFDTPTIDDTAKATAIKASKETLLTEKKNNHLSDVLEDWQKKYVYEIDYTTLQITVEEETSSTTTTAADTTTAAETSGDTTSE